MAKNKLQVRLAESGDVPGMVELIEAQRIEYQKFAPVFWRKAEDSARWSQTFFDHVVQASTHTALVAREHGHLQGFLIAFAAPVPPVFKPGAGPTMMIDDFCVATPDLWPTAGAALLDALRTRAKEEQWSQLVSVTAHLDRPKTEFLAGQGLSLTSEWWTTPI